MVEPILSIHNPKIKQLRSLASNRKDRRRERLFIVEGVRLVGEALARGADLSLVVYDADHLAQSEAGNALLRSLEGRRNAFPAAPEVLALAADTVTPQGIVAAVRWPDLIARAGGLRLVLDAVQDPGNVGTLLRAAEAAGVSDVTCISGTADVWSPKVVRAAMGTHFRLPIVQDVRWDSLELLGDHIYVTDADSRLPYYAVDWKQPSVIVIGNEANGVSPEARAVAMQAITIPMAGEVESLNAAVAGSVILFEAARQRRLGHS